ncbi:diguanylate cyclase [Paenibacillus nanensis]|uniref:Diguanylate cyclase n=1 Tax=Paenibacillus nanensis TaxID=393251 RepID=A0A3A1UKN2_9BACL|nr:sensor domain-containing diguanylate cyclase [Paenibacillus nanensis]RIX47248.1 diguanylate cyclase [Paenibacillus nanensis]
MPQKNAIAQPDLFQQLFDHHSDGICIVDEKGHFLYANVSLLAMLGYTREEISQLTWEQLLAGEAASRSILPMQHQKGHPVYVKLASIPLEHGSLFRIEKVSRYREHRKELIDAQEMFSFLSEKSQNIISSISADGVFTYVSPTVQALLGYTPAEVVGQTAASFNHPETNKKLLEHRSSLFVDQNTVKFTGLVRHKNGGYRWYETTVEYIRDESGDIIQSIGVGWDITDRKEAEETILHLAFHDSLTDLPNRRLFIDKVNARLKGAANELHALLLIDLDGFKAINDRFGHDRGDVVLIEVAHRLTAAIGDKECVARWGGDEFTILLTSMNSKTDLTILIERVKEAIAEPFRIAGHTHVLSASIGFSYFREDGDSVEALIRHADAAMYRSKREAKIET